MLSDRIKGLIAQSGLTVNKVAERSGVPAATISRICSGKTPNPQFQTVVDICTAIGCTPDVLLYPDAGAEIDFVHPSQEPLDERMVDQYERLIAEKDLLIQEKTQRLDEKDKAIAFKDKWIKAMAITIGAVMLVLLGRMLVDIISHLT